MTQTQTPATLDAPIAPAIASDHTSDVAVFRVCAIVSACPWTGSNKLVRMRTLAAIGLTVEEYDETFLRS